MLNEFCIACALPHSLAPTRSFHVSLFFAPTIRPPSPTKLPAPNCFVDWAQALRTELAL